MVKVLSFRFQIFFGQFTCHLLKEQKMDFLDIDRTTFFVVGKSKNTSAMRVIFFENLQN